MAHSTAPDASEDVNDFLLRIRELGDKRDKEDEERTRKLEEEILQGRKERQARRAERARSISPTKDSPSPISGTPLHENASLEQRSSQISIEPPIDLQPSRNTDPDASLEPNNPPTEQRGGELDGSPDASQDKMESASAENRELPSGNAPSFNATVSSRRGRSGTLSWQQRPGSRQLPDSKSSAMPSLHPRGNSAATISTSPKRADNSETSSDSPPEASRAQIAHSLGGKDPSWFRQTADRGLNSPAYRKGPDDTASNRSSVRENKRLPGLAKEPSSEGKSTTDEPSAEGSRSPSRASTTNWSSSLGNRYSSVSSVSTTAGLGSPLPITSSQKLEAPHQPSSPPNRNSTPPPDRLAMSPAQGRLSPERSSSPTKGLGGFVQSAMMKRSDSVSKRWSAQVTPGLGRRDSVVSNRSGFGGSLLGPLELKSPTSRETSPLPNSRPGSSHSEATVVHHRPGLPDRPTTSGSSGAREEFPPTDGPSRPTLSTSSSTLSSSSANATKSQAPGDSDASLPISPSKTMDSRRWSPTKASWLESALNRPESPTKPKVSHSHQPSWLVELNKSRQQRGSVDLGKPSTFKEVTPIGLMRSPPPGPQKKTQSISGIPDLMGIAPPNNGGQNSPLKTEEKEQTENLPQDVSNETPPEKDPASQKVIAQPSPKTELSESSEGQTSPTSPVAQNDPAASSKTTLDSISSKSKPQAPPATDFRSNLRRRQESVGSAPRNEPEFKNVFGKLKRTETNKYVAQDEFKDNIMRGKSALNITGGPKKTQRVDELKESLLKQKEAMKAGGGSIRPNAGLEKENKSPGKRAPIPEAIARRNTLSRSDSISSSTSFSSPTAPSFRQNLRPLSPNKTTTQEPMKSPPAEDPVKAPPLQASLAKGKLADRVNPALAGILSRGPPGANGDTAKAKSPAGGDSSLDLSPSAEQPSSAAPLTHMTKARARGPKRRTPKATGATTEPAPAAKTQEMDSPVQDLPSLRKSDLGSSPTTPSEPEGTSGKPAVSSKSPELRRLASLSSVTAKSESDKPPTPSGKKPDIYSLRNESAASITSLSLPPGEKEEERPAPPPKPSGSPQPPPKIFGQVKGLGIDRPVQEKASYLNRSLPTPPERSAASPPVPRKSERVTSRSFENMKGSPVPESNQDSEVRQLLSGVFGAMPKSSDQVDIDPQIIMSKADQRPKIRTIKKAIWEMNGDGRRQDLPTNQEHVLFEDSMYLMVHNFEASNASPATQVHLWCGDGVPEASFQDAQLFARKVARENSAKLELLKQGKEPATFIQALGGILITRRGSGSRTNSGYMLCGRGHIGQIVFDEVESSLQNLCSGFPYILSAKPGKLHIWKGKGSGVDEVGAAKLTGMDLDPTAEIIEISEGEEPKGFFEIFAGVQGDIQYQSSDFWRLKPNHEKYACRLYRIAHELGQSTGFWGRRSGGSTVARPNDTVEELVPFCQHDINSSNIYVLDAFFEIFVIVGSSASSKGAEFASAVNFAQEYGILAASLQDRPLIPKTVVAVGGVPEECQMLFRKWTEKNSTPAVKTFSLNEAIEALRS